MLCILHLEAVRCQCVMAVVGASVVIIESKYSKRWFARCLFKERCGCQDWGCCWSLMFASEIFYLFFFNIRMDVQGSHKLVLENLILTL